MYIISIELLLSTNTLLVLKPLISSTMTSGSSCGCLIPLESRLENVILAFSDYWYFRDRCLMSTLFICLWWVFFKDLYDLLDTGPPIIIHISPTACFGWSRPSSLASSWHLSSILIWGWWSTWKNFWSFPRWINSSICSFRSWHSSL